MSFSWDAKMFCWQQLVVEDNLHNHSLLKRSWVVPLEGLCHLPPVLSGVGWCTIPPGQYVKEGEYTTFIHLVNETVAMQWRENLHPIAMVLYAVDHLPADATLHPMQKVLSHKNFPVVEQYKISRHVRIGYKSIGGIGCGHPGYEPRHLLFQR